MLTRVRFGGLGGQGIVLAGSILGEAATLAGLNAAGSNSYGAAARGTACRTDVVLSDLPIDYPHLGRAEVLAVMSQAAYKMYLPVVLETGRVFYDDFSVVPLPESTLPHSAVPATAVAVKEFGNRQGANIILLGAVVAATRAVPVPAVLDALRKSVRERFLAPNLKALELGLAMGDRIREGGTVDSGDAAGSGTDEDDDGESCRRSC